MILPTKERSVAGLKAGLIHLLISGMIVGIVAIIVFQIWFPYPYGEIAGGRNLFWTIIAVDVVAGPVLTALVFNPKKIKKELIQDISCIFFIQVIALVIGVYTVIQTRPIYLAFEVDRFKVVTYADIIKKDLSPNEQKLHRIPWSGVPLIGTKIPLNGDEMLESLELSMQGYDPAFRPKAWVEYDTVIEDVNARAHPISDLVRINPDRKMEIDRAVLQSGLSEAEIAWLPVTSYRTLDWVALINRKTAMPIYFINIDGFKS